MNREKINDNIAKMTVAKILSGPAAKLLQAQDVAKQYLVKIGRTEEEADKLVAEILTDYARIYAEGVEKGELKTEVEVMVL